MEVSVAFVCSLHSIKLYPLNLITKRFTIIELTETVISQIIFRISVPDLLSLQQCDKAEAYSAQYKFTARDYKTRNLNPFTTTGRQFPVLTLRLYLKGHCQIHHSLHC